MKANRKKKAMLKALEKSLGIVSHACKSIGIHRSTHYDWLESDPDYRSAVTELEEDALDLSESKLFERIVGVKLLSDKNNPESAVYQVPPSDRAIIFHLKTKGKKRGYIERNEPFVKQQKYGKDLEEEEEEYVD